MTNGDKIESIHDPWVNGHTAWMRRSLPFVTRTFMKGTVTSFKVIAMNRYYM